MQPAIRFGSFELRAGERVLLSQGSSVVLGARALDVLLALVARQGGLVSKEELQSAPVPPAAAAGPDAGQASWAAASDFFPAAAAHRNRSRKPTSSV